MDKTLQLILSYVVPIGIFFVVMYLFIMRPEKKRQGQILEMQAKIKKNDKIITIGGIHGIVDDVKDNVATIIISSGARMKVDVSAIKTVISE